MLSRTPLNENRPLKSLLPGMILSVIMHGIVLISIMMASWFYGPVVKPVELKVITVELATECPLKEEASAPDSTAANPARGNPVFSKILPPLAPPPAKAENTRPEKDQCVPQEKKPQKPPPLALAAPPPNNAGDTHTVPITTDVIEAPSSIILEDNGKAMPSDNAPKLSHEGSRGVSGDTASSSRVGGKAGENKGGSAGSPTGDIVDAKPLYKNNPPPYYPLTARKRNLEGTVVILALVNRKGRVIEASVDTSSGHPALDDAAVAAVKSWEFEPARHGNDPVESLVKLPISFHLK